MGMSAKQVAADVRKTLRRFTDDTGTTRGSTLRWTSGKEITLPAGLGFSVRAARTGVNITIEDRGWVDVVTGGDRQKISEFQREKKEICTEVDTIRGMWQPPLPGETRWGLIIISARAGATTHMSSRSKTCDRCGGEVSEWREEIGSPFSLEHRRPEIVCQSCHHQE